jgi:hypothetical protein
MVTGEMTDVTTDGMDVARIGAMIDEMLGQKTDGTVRIFRRVVNRIDNRMTATIDVAQMGRSSRSPFLRWMKRPYFVNGIWAPKSTNPSFPP